MALFGMMNNAARGLAGGAKATGRTGAPMMGSIGGNAWAGGNPGEMLKNRQSGWRLDTTKPTGGNANPMSYSAPKPVGSSPLTGMFGKLAGSAGGYASINPNQLKEGRTPGIDPNQVKEARTRGIDPSVLQRAGTGPAGTGAFRVSTEGRTGGITAPTEQRTGGVFAPQEQRTGGVFAPQEQRTGGIFAPQEQRTGGIDPNSFDAQMSGGINWGAFGDSEIAKRFSEGADLANAETQRKLFGDSGIGGAFGSGGSALARSGLLSSGAMGNLGEELGGTLARESAMARNKAAQDALGMFGNFETSDLGRMSNELQQNAARGAALAQGNQQVASGERIADLGNELAASMSNQQTASSERGQDLQRMLSALQGNQQIASGERISDLANQLSARQGNQQTASSERGQDLQRILSALQGNQQVASSERTGDLNRDLQGKISNREISSREALGNREISSREREGDLNRLLSSLQGNQQIASSERGGDLNRLQQILDRNMVTSSIERTGDLDRLRSVLEGNANRRQAGIDRDIRTSAGLFDALRDDQNRERERAYNAAKLPIDLAQGLQSASPVSTSSSQGANPLWGKVMDKVIDRF